MANFADVTAYTPVEEQENTFAPINEKNLKCILSVTRTEGDKEWNMGNDLVIMSLQVAEGQKYAGRFVGNYGKAMEYNLDEQAGAVKTKNDGSNYTIEKSGIQKLANFFFNKVSPTIEIKDEASLTGALTSIDGMVFVVDCYPKKKRGQEEKMQGFRVKKIAEDDDDAEVDVSDSKLDF